MTVAGALWAWARGRPLLTGVLIGLGTAVKLYPLFLLGAVLVICLRQRRDSGSRPWERPGRGSWPTCRRTSGPSGGRSSGRSTPTAAPTSGRCGWSCSRRWSRPATRSPSTRTINVGSWLFFGAWCIGVLLLGLSAPSTPRLAQLGFLVVAGFLLVNKVYLAAVRAVAAAAGRHRPAALARPDHLAGRRVLYFAAVWWYLGGFLAPAGGGDAAWYWAATILRSRPSFWLVAMVVRDIVRPRPRPVVQRPGRAAFPPVVAICPRGWGFGRLRSRLR